MFRCVVLWRLYGKRPGRIKENRERILKLEHVQIHFQVTFIQNRVVARTIFLSLFESRFRNRKQGVKYTYREAPILH